MDDKSQKVFCSLLDDWRHQNLFCDAYLVGDDSIVIPIHKLVLASKAYLLLIELNEKMLPTESIFIGETRDNNNSENHILYVKGYTGDILDAFIKIIYIQDFTLVATDDLKLQMCYFLLQISKLLNLNDAYVIKCIENLQRSTASSNEPGCNTLNEQECEEVPSNKSSHKCHFCKKIFASHILLNCHLKLHAEPRKLAQSGSADYNTFISNESCSKTKKRGRLKVFQKHLSYKFDEFACNECQKTFSSRVVLRRHIKKLHTKECLSSMPATEETKNKFACFDCGKKFTTSGNLRRHHSIIHRGIKRFHCPICNCKFGQKVTLDFHLAGVHKIVDAQQESVESNGSVCLATNRRDVGTAEFSLSQAADLGDLFRKSDFDVSSLFVCSGSDLETRVRDAKDILPAAGSSSTQTMGFIDKDKWKERTTCKICQKQLSRPSNLRKHMSIHEANKRIDLNIDNTLDSTQLSMEYAFHHHLLKASEGQENGESKLKNGKGSFVCHHCGKKFLLADYLKKHMSVTHCAAKMFPCLSCPKRFASKTRLKRHQAVHEKKKCDRCNKFLEGQRAYKNHLKTSCEVPSFPIQDDNSFPFGDPLIANITLEMLSAQNL